MIDGEAIRAPSFPDDRSVSAIATQARDATAICSTLDNQPSPVWQSHGALRSVKISDKPHWFLRYATIFEAARNLSSTGYRLGEASARISRRGPRRVAN